MKTQQKQVVTEVNSSLLIQVMEYRHPQLVARLAEKLEFTQEDAGLLFADTKRFLFLSHVSKESLSPTKMIDEGWHNFILYTIDYANFCQANFGHFIHHIPTNPLSIKKPAKIKDTLVLAKNEFGVLSKFWTVAKGDSKFGDCTPAGCQDKDCSTGDCKSNR